MTPEQQIESDLASAAAAEARAHEKAILDWADGLIVAGSHTAAEALKSGFKAKVPIAGGSIGNAIETAIDSMDATAETTLKERYETAVAAIEAKIVK